MDWTRTADIATTVAAALAILGGFAAIVTYYRASQTRRAEWLASLHEKFFETDRYANVRRVLDYRSEPEYAELRTAVAAGEAHPLADELYRYLNFFEFLASLRGLRQISDKEISSLFDYDLKMLTKHDFIVDALAPQGFENLDALLVRLRVRPRSK